MANSIAYGTSRYNVAKDRTHFEEGMMTHIERLLQKSCQSVAKDLEPIPILN